jgi:hypothetical protein
MSNATSIQSVSKTFTTLNGLTKNTKYYWQVRSKSQYGRYSSYSAIQNFTPVAVTAVNEKQIVPTQYSLSQNYPNPFNPSTVIKYQLKADSKVSLTIYNILGQEVANLVNEEQKAGTYSVNFNASRLSSGVYFYKLQAGSFTSTKKMMLLK